MLPLQFPYGLLNGRLVTPEEAPRGLSDVVCLDCGEPLVAAQGDVIRPYFRHQSGIDDWCNYGGEGVRHRLAKIALAERIQQAISDSVDLPIEWLCQQQVCPIGKHNSNLVKGATNISVDDLRVGPFMPDIGIFQSEICRVFVEVEQSHPNTDDKIAYCEAEGISLVSVVIRDCDDPVDRVRLTPLRVSCSVCLYWLGRTCKCEESKPDKAWECINCLRNKRGIDIDIAGSYKTQTPKLGIWVAIVTDVDGKEWEYIDQDVSSNGTYMKMLRGALVKLEKIWKGHYQVRVNSIDDLTRAQSAKQIFAGRVIPKRYWLSIRDNHGKGKPKPERLGRLVKDRPQLARAIEIAKSERMAKTHP